MAGAYGARRSAARLDKRSRHSLTAARIPAAYGPPSRQLPGAHMTTKLLVSLCAAVALLSACSKREETAPPADTAAPPADTTATPPADTTAPPASETPPPPDQSAPPPADSTQPSNPPPS